MRHVCILLLILASGSLFAHPASTPSSPTSSLFFSPFSQPLTAIFEALEVVFPSSFFLTTQGDDDGGSGDDIGGWIFPGSNGGSGGSAQPQDGDDGSGDDIGGWIFPGAGGGSGGG